MRILAVGPMPPKADGLADYTDGVAAAYTAAGHDVSVIADTPAPRSDPRVVAEVSLSPKAFLRSAWTVLTHPVTVLHVQHTVATYAVRLIPLWTLVVLARLRGVRVLVTHHEVTRDIRRLGLIGRIYYRVVSRLAHVVHVHTIDAESTMVRVLGFPAARVAVHPHPVFPPQRGGVSGDALRARHDLAGRLVVLQLGFIQVEKGLSELVEGLGTLNRRRPDLTVHLVVAGGVRARPAGLRQFEAGDHAYLDTVYQRVSELGLADRVRFTGHVPAEEMTGWLEAADLVTLPYLAIEQSGIANRAVSADVPVIATRAGGLAELLLDLPGFDDLTPDSVADALEEAIGDLPGVTARAQASYARIRELGDPGRLVEMVTPHVVGRSVHV